MLDKIYILHHKPLIERKEYLSERLKDENIEFQWVENWLPDEVSDKYDKLIEGYEKFIDVQIIHPYGEYRNFSKKLSIGDLSLILKHEWCFKDQIDNNYQNILILEDDVNIPQNFKKYIDNNMKDFLKLNEENNVEVLVMGISHGMTTKYYKSGKYIHFGPNQLTRCTHAIAYNINGTKKILPKMTPRNLPIDFKLNEVFTIEKINVSWSEPGLSQNNIFSQNKTNSQR